MTESCNQESGVRPGPRHRPGLAAAVAFGLAMLSSASATAQVGANAVQRTFINLGFEEPNLETVGCRVYIGEDFVPGWTTTHGLHQQENVGGCVVPAGFVAGDQANIVELWRAPRTNSGLTVQAREGTQLAELNAEQLSRLSQNVCLVQGEQVRWRFSHRGRASATVQDEMQFLIGTDPIVHVGTTNTGAGGVLTDYLGGAGSAAGPDSWRDYEGTFSYSGAGGVTNIGFEALSGSSTLGNFLDRIEVFLMPFVELNADGFETVEGTTGGLPSLSIAGTVESDLTIEISVTGGTAVLGTDFNTPGGGLMFSVVVPAGVYDGDVIPLGLEAIGNGLVDGSRTVELTLQLSPDYVPSSTSECGDPAITETTWTILDDDLDLSIAKAVDPTTAMVGETVTYTLVVNHLEGVDGSGALVQDPAVTGLDCSGATLSCSATGDAQCPDPLTIGALQGSGLVIPFLEAGGSVEISFACEVVDTP